MRTLADLLPSSRDVPESGTLLRFSDVTLEFAGVRALDDVSFAIDAHELLAIIGPNGAGKTSIFNCISGVYHPTHGSVRLLDEELLGMHPATIAERGVARTFQNIELFENLTVVDNLLLGRHHHIRYGTLASMFRTRAATREELVHREVVEDIIDFLHIERYRNQIVGMLPYGIQKRVELGRALAMEPKLLLLDEPVAGMNLEETEDMARFILDIRDELAVTIILVEHDMGVVMDLADRVLVLDFGQVVADGAPAVVQDDPAVIKAYLGESGEKEASR